MKILPLPNLQVATEDLFEMCVSSYRDEYKKTRLLHCKSIVSTDAKNYRQFVPQNIDSFCVSELPENVSTSEMAKVYKDKFAAVGAVGRKYYNAIMAQAVRGVCPICGIRTVSTLDHYLPQSKIPTLVLEPSNLFPSCRDCNMDKKTAMSFDPHETPVHIYFDQLPDDIWLHVNIGTDLEVVYYISCPKDWDKTLRGRVEHHLENYHLHNLYSAHAAVEIEDNKMKWRNLFCLGAEGSLFEHIKETRVSAEANDLNSWKSALYRGLEAEFQKVVLWLKNMAQ